jgi:hypothetical protein
MKEAND